MDAQRKATTIALTRYRVGYSSHFDVINADRDLFTAELSLTVAHLNTLLSLQQLYRAVGGGWQTEQSGKSVPERQQSPVLSCVRDRWKLADSQPLR